MASSQASPSRKSCHVLDLIYSGLTKGLREYEEFLKSPMVGVNEIEYGFGEIK